LLNFKSQRASFDHEGWKKYCAEDIKNKHVLDIIKPDVSLESKILKHELKYFGNMRNDNLLEKAIMFGKMQGKRKVG
jgi:hypothetical protein